MGGAKSHRRSHASDAPGRLPAAKLGECYWVRGAALLDLVTADFDKKAEAALE